MSKSLRKQFSKNDEKQQKTGNKIDTALKHQNINIM